MKTIHKSHSFTIVWNVYHNTTRLPFDFTGKDVEVSLFSNSYKSILKNYSVIDNAITADISADELPCGVYSIVCRYSTLDEQAYTSIPNAFQISTRPIFDEIENQVLLESYVSNISPNNIITQFNSLFVRYLGSSYNTRNNIPMELRRTGLIITYINEKGFAVTERASSSVQKENNHWGLDVNWSRIDELSLSGDISISSNGTWIINGVDSGKPAIGSKGDTGLTPWLKTIDNRLHFSYDNINWELCSDYIAHYFRLHNNRLQISHDKLNWEDFSDEIAAYFRFQAIPGGERPESVGKIQISRDNKTWTDLSPEFENHLRIAGYVAEYANLPTNKPVGTIIGVGPTTDESGNSSYRFYVYDGDSWVDNGSFTSIAAGIVQETGNSENVVMSQKAVTKELSDIKSKLLENTLLITKSSNRISQGLKLAAGKTYLINIEVEQGSDPYTWTLYGYKDGKLDASRVLVGNRPFGAATMVSIPEGDDGVWLFTDVEQSNNRTYKVIYSEEGNLSSKVLKLEEDNKVQDEKIADLETKSKSSGDLFVLYGKRWFTDRNVIVDSIDGVSTPILQVGTKLTATIYSGSYWGIYLLDEEQKTIDFITSENVGINTFDIDFSNYPTAKYFIISTDKTYVNECYVSTDILGLYLRDIEDIKSNETMNSTVYIDFIYKKYVDSNGIIQSFDSYRMTDYILVNEGVIANVYDGGDSYIVRGISFYDKNREWISALDLGSSAGNKEVVLTSENIPENAVYFIASTLLDSIDAGISKVIYPLSYSIKDISDVVFKLEDVSNKLEDIGEKVEDLTGDIGTQIFSSKNNRIGIWVDNTPSKSQYLIKVECDNPYSGKFGIFKAQTNHEGIQTITYNGVYNKWFTIEKDDNKPVLYIFDAETPDGYGESREYRITFKATDSLTQRVERLENSSSGWNGKTIVCIGDSITEFKDSNSKRYSDYIAELTGANVINIGIGGTQFKQRTIPVVNPTSQWEAYAALDIINMIKAACEQDFEKQINAAEYLKSIDNNISIINTFQTIDWSSVSAVTIMAGTNDWNGGEYWGTVDSTSINYTYGAIKEIIKMLMTTYPHLSVYWFTPTVRWLTDNEGVRTDETFSDNFKRNNMSLREFSATIEELVKKYHIPVCDMYNTLGWNQYNFDQYFTSTDGTHPTKGRGMEMIAKKICSFIDSNRTF